MGDMATGMGAIKPMVRIIVPEAGEVAKKTIDKAAGKASKVVPLTEGHASRCNCESCMLAWKALSDEGRLARRAAFAETGHAKLGKQEGKQAGHKPGMKAPQLARGGTHQPDFEKDRNDLNRKEKRTKVASPKMETIETNPVELGDNQVLDVWVQTSRGLERVRIGHRSDRSSLFAFIGKKGGEKK